MTTFVDYRDSLYPNIKIQNWRTDRGFELKCHDKQFNLLLDNFGENSKDIVQETLIKFNKLIPKELDGRHRFNTLSD